MNKPCARITLDLQQASTPTFVAVKKSDIGREIRITLSDGGFPYEISADCYAVLTGTKPDGNILYNHCDIEGNTIVYEITEQTTAAAGRMKAEVKLYGADDILVTSATFRIIIDGTVYTDDKVESSSEFSALTQLISQVVEIIQKYSDVTTVTKTSELINDSGFITNAVSDLVNYYTKTDIGNLISNIPKFRISVVSYLPTEDISETTIYLLPGGDGSDLYTEYLRVDGKWEILGSQRVDLTGYATEEWVEQKLEEHSGGNVDLTGYATEQWVKDQNFLTEVPDGYAKSSEIPKKPEDIGAQPSGNYALKSEIPSVPVQSVNSKTGAVQLSAADVGARPENWMPTAQDVGALPSTYTPPDQTAEQVGADPVGTAAVAVSSHNTDEDAHNDIRLELKAISERLTAFFDSDDQTLDELSEIVSYITNNKTLIESITTIKVSVADIVNNLTSNVSNKPLSAAQGVVLKGLIDTVSNSLANYQPKGNYALRDELPTVPTKVSAFENDKGYLTQHQDISHKLDANKLPEAVNTALAQAKASGEFDGNPGKTAYAYAQEAGYTGTEEEFAEKLAQEPLVGTTAEITPSQVAEAIEAGRLVRIVYTDKNFGVFYFTSFDINVSLNVIFSSAILQYDGLYAVVELIGDMSTDKWQFIIQQIPIMSDVPTKTSQLTNDSGFLTSAPVTSVNGKTGAVSIDIPTVPSALKNPYALTINGTAYDGSKAVNISIQGGNGDAIPDYVRAEAERVAKLVQSRQNANTITFLACSDIHLPIESHDDYENIKNGLIHAGRAMELLRKQVHMDFAFCSGDMFWSAGDTAETAMDTMRFIHEVFSAGFAGVQFWTEGNHERAFVNNSVLTAEQIFANIGAWNTGAVFNPNDRIGGYCYKDFEDYKVRVVCINTGDGYNDVSTKQNTWLAEALSVPVEEGWGTILLSHTPLDWNGGNATETTNVMNTIKAAEGIICAIHGHTHCYKIDKMTGTDITRIAVPNICSQRNNEYGRNGSSFGETSTYNKTANTANETAFSVITIDRQEGKAYVDYYGARPEDTRTVEGLLTYAKTTYTNLVPTSLDPATGAVYNGIGYKNDVYGSGAIEGSSADTECVLTGIIPYDYTHGERSPIYIKGAKIDTSKSHCRIIGFNSVAMNTASFQLAIGSKIPTYFNVEALGEDYYKVTPLEKIGEENPNNSVGYWRFSLIGEGENLIITINEPIE